ncbi:MAG: hypothetical protein ACI9FU_000963 [Granulosicoccus sp.]|jgi:hypothetical protein
MKPILAILLFIPLFGTAQVYPDSLLNVLEDETQPDTIRLQAIKKIAWEIYLSPQPDSAFYFAGLQYDFAKEKKLTIYMITALNTQGASLYIQGEYEAAAERFTESLQLAERIRDQKR